jgi:hypothetical protein
VVALFAAVSASGMPGRAAAGEKTQRRPGRASFMTGDPVGALNCRASILTGAAIAQACGLDAHASTI